MIEIKKMMPDGYERKIVLTDCVFKYYGFSKDFKQKNIFKIIDINSAQGIIDLCD